MERRWPPHERGGRRVDEAAFRAMFDAHMPDVWRYARRRCPSADDADDVVADTFAVAWRRRSDIPDEGAHLWLLAVARRVLSNQRRSARRLDGLRVRVASTASPDVHIDSAEDSAVAWEHPLWSALASLSPSDRDLLIMRAWDGLAVGDIAILLGCSANAASLRLRTARRRLAEAIEQTDTNGSRTSHERSRAPEAGQR
jgi:RNA polymerase sigma-70 factor (ECF subfamily)